MNQKLITLNGNFPSEAPAINVGKKDDVAAGLIFWGTIAKMYPGITWGDIYLDGLGRPWWKRVASSVGDGISDAVSKTGKIISDVVDKTGEKSGEAIRLFSDEKVQDAVSRGVQAYATGGTSEALRAFLPAGNKSAVPASQNPVVTGGQGIKQASFNLDFKDPKIMAIGAGGLILAVLLLGRR